MKPTTTLALGLVLLAGCTTKNYYSDDLKPLPTTGITEPARKVETTFARLGDISESDFLDGVHEADPVSMMMDDSDLLLAGYAVCEAIDNGATAQDLGQAMAETATENYNTAELIAAVSGLATVWLCPEHIDIWSE